MPRTLWAPALVLGGALLSCGARADRTAAGPPGPVEAVLPAARAEVLAAIHRAFNDGLDRHAPNKFPPADPLHAFALYPREVPSGYGYVALPDDLTLHSNSRDDPAMERYLRLPPAQRRDDLFLYHALERYWLSEPTVHGKPVEFACDYILHVEAEGEARTRVEVLEVRPVIRVGKKLALSAHGVGVGTVDDIRPVPPTVRDRQDILRRIAAAAGHSLQ